MSVLNQIIADTKKLNDGNEAIATVTKSYIRFNVVAIEKLNVEPGDKVIVGRLGEDMIVAKGDTEVSTTLSKNYTTSLSAAKAEYLPQGTYNLIEISDGDYTYFKFEVKDIEDDGLDATSKQSDS